MKPTAPLRKEWGWGTGAEEGGATPGGEEAPRSMIFYTNKFVAGRSLRVRQGPMAWRPWGGTPPFPSPPFAGGPAAP